MICNSCYANVQDGMPFCPYCGAALTAEPQQPCAAEAQQPCGLDPARAYAPVSTQPYNPGQQPAAPVRHPAQPLVGMICGIVSFILSIVIYFVFIVDSAFHRVTAVEILLCVLTGSLAIVALIFSIIGMRKSIRTGGRKYVAGIVFSAVGISLSASAIMFLLLGVVIGSVAATATRSSSRYSYRIR